MAEQRNDSNSSQEALEVLVNKISELEKALSEKEKKLDEYRALAKVNNLEDVNGKYKDTLFRFIFGKAENKRWTLSLYNAINNTNYTNVDDLEFNMIRNAMYMRMKNDISFFISSELNMWEHQGTYNPNMPMRFFIYGGRLYEKYILTSDYYEYSSTLQPIPCPVCICFYNGTKEQPERQVLRLSDAYEGKGNFEVEVTMLNINYGKNQRLMDACKPLKEYAWLVDTVRRHQKEGMELDPAVDATLKEMPDYYVIKRFLAANQAEVKSMFLSDYSEQRIREKERAEGRAEGIAEGIEIGINGRNSEIATSLLKKGFVSVSFISEISKLSEEAVKALAKSMNILL